MYIRCRYTHTLSPTYIQYSIRCRYTRTYRPILCIYVVGARIRCLLHISDTLYVVDTCMYTLHVCLSIRCRYTPIYTMGIRCRYTRMYRPILCLYVVGACVRCLLHISNRSRRTNCYNLVDSLIHRWTLHSCLSPPPGRQYVYGVSRSPCYPHRVPGVGGLQPTEVVRIQARSKAQTLSLS